jgi:hypothetical protein
LKEGMKAARMSRTGYTIFIHDSNFVHIFVMLIFAATNAFASDRLMTPFGRIRAFQAAGPGQAVMLEKSEQHRLRAYSFYHADNANAFREICEDLSKRV